MNITSPLSAPDTAKIVIALHTYDLELETKTLLLHQEQEQTIQQMKKQMEHEISQQAEQSAKRIRGLIDLYHKELSAYSQRLVLEGVFKDIVKAIPRNQDLQTALNTSCVGVDPLSKKLMLAGDMNVPMISVNFALFDLPFRLAAWKVLGFQPDLRYPEMSRSLFYGDLCSSFIDKGLLEHLHEPSGKKDDIDDVIAAAVREKSMCFEAMAEQALKKIELFAEKAATDGGAVSHSDEKEEEEEEV